jgi:hypothetical protein
MQELRSKGVDPTAVLTRYEALGYELSLFDEAWDLRRVSPEEVLATSRGLQHPADFSVILSRARKPRFRDHRACPVRIEGLELDETSDGLSIFHPARNRVHHLNATAALIFDLCNGENPPAKIIQVVQSAFGLPSPPADEVARCLENFRGEGLVT